MANDNRIRYCPKCWLAATTQGAEAVWCRRCGVTWPRNIALTAADAQELDRVKERMAATGSQVVDVRIEHIGGPVLVPQTAEGQLRMW